MVVGIKDSQLEVDLVPLCLLEVIRSNQKAGMVRREELLSRISAYDGNGYSNRYIRECFLTGQGGRQAPPSRPLLTSARVAVEVERLSGDMTEEQHSRALVSLLEQPENFDQTQSYMAF